MELLESLGRWEIHPFGHEHSLKFREINHGDEILCSACKKFCSGQTYVCKESNCDFFLHDSCFDLPRRIHHPFHPHHPLTLYSPNQRHHVAGCKVCERYYYGFTYSCDYCTSFCMGVQYPVMISTINYEGHSHNILFVDGLDPCQGRAHGDDSYPYSTR